MEQAMQQRRRSRPFTAAYKAEVVELCRKGDRSIPEVAR
jgi:transposase-like protein